jgi:hypothetical protein
MKFKKPLIKSDKENLYYLAPVPVLQKKYEDKTLHDWVYVYAFNKLNKVEKQMGQELPERYDEERQVMFETTDIKDMWVEETEKNPIGSRFHTPPNNFLDEPNEKVQEIRKRIEDSFFELLDSLEIPHHNKCKITESWIQYYDPYEGRGHNQHNHCRWQPNEEAEVSFSGGYYLNDGEPIKDHPYSGAFCFHIRGMAHFIRPKNGMLMIWPNDIVHSVKPFYGKKHRCVINFNIEL